MNVAHQELAKLHFINTLFADTIGPDFYFAQQVKSGIESALSDEIDPEKRDENFTRAAIILLQNHFRRRPSHGFAHWEATAAGSGFDPLWARQELISLLKKLAPYPAATILVTNLRTAIFPDGKRVTRALHTDYADAVRYIQELARTYTTARAQITLLFF